MSDHLSTKELQRYRAREMSPLELLAADDHLAGCDGCRAGISPVAGPDVFFGNAAPGHLSYEKLEAIVDGKADAVDNEIADVHLKVCETCAADLAAIFAVRDEIAADDSAPPFESWAERLGRMFTAGWPVLAGTAGIILAAALFVWFATRPSESDIAAVTNSNSVPAVPVDSPESEPKPIVVESPSSNSNGNSDAAPERFEFLPAPIRAEAERAVASGKLNVPNLDELSGKTGQLMGGGDDSVPFGLIGPLGRVVESNRPTLSWHPLSGAEAYQVEIYDTDYNLVESSPKNNATSWRPGKLLARGKTYVWQVTAFKDGEEVKSPVRPAPDARFRVLDAAQFNDIELLRRRFPNEHLALGIVYARAGLIAEAAAEFRRELARNPKASEAKRLLADLNPK